MGMFDYINVADKLPTNSEIDALGIDLSAESFQTKDLDNVMASYYIQGGRLFVEKYRKTEWIEDSESFLGGYIDRQEPYKEELDGQHGKIYFYTWLERDEYDYWVEYVAYFTHGKLDKIELFKCDKTANAERKQRKIEWQQREEVERNKWYNKYIFRTKVWAKIRRLINNILYAIERGIGYIRLRIP